MDDIAVHWGPLMATGPLEPQARRGPKAAPCLICGKPTQPWERNRDGSYAHDHCLRANAQRMHPTR